jgi:hypothetical protein
VRLAWKFKPGDRFYIENGSRLKQTLKTPDATTNQDVTTTVISQIKVKEKTRDSVLLEQKIETVKAKGTGDAAQLADLIKKMAGAVFTITLNPAGKVTRFVGYKDLLQRIRDDDKQAAQLFQLALPEEALKQEMAGLFAFLPGKAVDKDEQWTYTETMPLAGIGNLRADNRYTFVGKSKQGAKIAVTTAVTFLPPKGKGGDAPAQITGGNLKSTGARGTILFDPNRGRMIRYELTLPLKGTLTMKVMGKTFKLNLVQESVTTIRILDRAPAQKE